MKFWVSIIFCALLFPLSRSCIALSLQEAIRIGIDRNQSVEVLQSRVIESERRISTAQTSYWPRLSASGTYTYVSRLPELVLDLPFGVEMPDIQFATHHVIDTKISGSFLIFDWGKRRKIVAQAVIGKELSETAALGGQQAVAYQISRAYITAALVAEQRRMLERYLEISNKHLQETQNRFDNGLVSKFDLLKSQMQTKIYEQQLTINEADLRIALNTLKLALGDDSVAIEVSEPLNSISVSEVLLDNGTFQEVMARKPEVIAYRKQQEISNLALGVEQLRPTISLFSSAGWKNSYLPDPDKLLFNYAGGAAINFDFFDGGHASKRRAEERAKQETLELEIERIVAETMTAVEINREELARVNAKSRITSERLELARSAMEIASVSYSTGMITNVDYLDTELQVQQIETEALKDRYDLLMATLELKRALAIWPEIE